MKHTIIYICRELEEDNALKQADSDSDEGVCTDYLVNPTGGYLVVTFSPHV